VILESGKDCKIFVRVCADSDRPRPFATEKQRYCDKKAT
jgi:hypothetical protein